MNQRIKIIGFVFYCLFSIFFLPMLLVKLGLVVGVDLGWCNPVVWFITQLATIFIGIAVFVDESKL